MNGESSLLCGTLECCLGLFGYKSQLQLQLHIDKEARSRPRPEHSSVAVMPVLTLTALKAEAKGRPLAILNIVIEGCMCEVRLWYIPDAE